MHKTLIVDDRDIFLIEMERLKVWGELSGFEIAGKANNGSQAIDLLRKNTYDLVLTDIRMPIMDGLQLLREIKRDRLSPCVVLISEYSEFNYARQGIVLGAFDYLVKPANEESILELLGRAKKFLYKNQEQSSKSFDSNSGPEWAYPAAEEKSIITHIKNKDFSAVQMFATTVENLYQALRDNIIKADIIIKKLYHNIVTAIYEEYKWLGNFTAISFFEEIDFLHEGNTDAFKEFYLRKLNFLIKFILKFQPDTQDENIRNICDYILNNPEQDLKLKVISDKFFINNTYLSNSFPAKTGIHFNDYVTMVKMARAEFLFKNTSLKTYEIGFQIGYRDLNYFMKQFKRINGKSPSEFRNSEYSDYQI
ncbi:putative response regulatory protein [Ruminiclostridium hungatei]|uniref:Stage 0 sporulation protein A homolog n=1 Tax=Ruminiclostridium hungatei TaxID=48256 RepID=A0A1V4SID4_RUMHU|nr:response regulator [Ruminiclostridium hungatei]OPX43266.1 putative response regulatory protein [Ruminiclostridium hungatei]